MILQCGNRAVVRTNSELGLGQGGSWTYTCLAQESQNGNPGQKPLGGRMRKSLFQFLLVCLACLPVFSQTFGEITGTVQDSAGAIVVGARITVTNTGTAATRETVT